MSTAFCWSPVALIIAGPSLFMVDRYSLAFKPILANCIDCSARFLPISSPKISSAPPLNCSKSAYDERAALPIPTIAVAALVAAPANTPSPTLPAVASADILPSDSLAPSPIELIEALASVTPLFRSLVFSLTRYSTSPIMLLIYLCSFSVRAHPVFEGFAGFGFA